MVGITLPSYELSSFTTLNGNPLFFLFFIFYLFCINVLRIIYSFFEHLKYK
jgi:hypothetical protein